MRVPAYRCVAQERTTPRGKWNYWIFDGDTLIEGSNEHFPSEQDALRAGYGKIEQMVRKRYA
jgi:hypothetical protein